MTLLFDRKYRLIIGQPDRKVQILNDNQNTLKDGYSAIPFTQLAGELPTPLVPSDWRTEVQDNRAVLITDLQMKADIVGESSNGNSDSTVIKIYNLSQETLNKVSMANNYVILEAGYAQDTELPMLFSGQVQNVYTVREGQDLVTIVSCSGGYTPNNFIKVSKTFSGEATYGDVLRYLAKAFADNGVPTGEIVDDWVGGTSPSNTTTPTPLIPSGVLAEYFTQIPVLIERPANTKLKTGMSVSGYLRQILDNVCKQIGYVHYITNGRLFIHPKGFTKTVEKYQFRTQQIKSLRKSSAKGSGSSGNVDIDGIDMVTFLDGRLDVDKRIEILDGDFEATYKITTKGHSLDYRGGIWDTSISCKRETG